MNRLPPPLTGQAAVAASIAPERVLKRLYLTLFLRGRIGRGLKKDKAPSSVGRKLLLSLIVYVLVGLFSLHFLKQSVFSLSVFLHGMTFVMLGLFVASSAGEVLFNKDEAEILLHRPVSPAAILKAKVSVLMQVALWLALALNLVGFFVGLRARDANWLFIPVHAASMFLEALFCTAVIVVGYQLCLKWFGRERLDNLMTGVQVLMALVMVGAGQVFPQLIGRIGGSIVLTHNNWWLALFPPVWFSCLDDALAGSGGLTAASLALFGVLLTVLVLWLAFRVLAQDYEEGLRTLQENVSRKPIRSGRRRFLSRLVEAPPFSWWLKDPVARSSFLLITAYLIRDRDVKLRVFPGLAPVLMMPVVMLINARSGESTGMVASFMIAFCGCYMGMIPLMALGMLRFSQHWQAAEVFRSAPIVGPGHLSHGARRAVLLWLTLPLAVLMAGMMYWLKPDPRSLLLLLPGFFLIPVLSMIPSVLQGFIPLAEPTDQSQSARKGAVMLIAMLGSMALAGVSLFAWHGGWFAWFVLGEIAVVALLYILLRKRVSCAPWELAV